MKYYWQERQTIALVKHFEFLKFVFDVSEGKITALESIVGVASNVSVLKDIGYLIYIAYTIKTTARKR